jgi:branched-chain amino acid transport system permease protein
VTPIPQPVRPAGRWPAGSLDVRWPTVRPGAAAGLAVVAAATAAAWQVDAYTLSWLSRLMSLGLLAVSVTILTGYAGLPSLGQVAPYAVGGYTTALLARAGHTVGPVQLVAVALAATVFSLLVGVAVTRTRGVVFLMVTLAVGVLTATAAEQWRSVTGGSDGLGGIPAIQPWWGAPPLDGDRATYLYILAVATLVVAGAAWVLQSPAGLLLRGCRDHETRMAASGHRVGGYLLTAYVAAGIIAGVGGALLVVGQRYLSPHDVGFDISALVLLAVVIGGARSLLGVLLATGLVVGVRDVAGTASPGHTPLLLGVLFVVAVYAPYGRRLAQQLRRVGPRVTDTEEAR